MAGLPGSFGKYFLCEKIAAGGMAEIYLAKLIGPGGFEKQLVVKQISPELGRQRQFVELFVAEAKTLVSLSHGNIVPVYELGVVDDTYFIAMEYVDGPPLAELLAGLDARGERLDPAVAAHVTAELCKGLDYAHRKGEGVVHRDLSPRNVLLSRDGEVKLVDFGLAVAGDRARQGQPGGGLPAGSFPYMSPEQVRREPLDPRSDLFSLGVLLWEMLTGERLFARGEPEATLAAVEAARVPAPSTLRPEVPPELDRVCARALARDRDDRFASAGDILAAVARFAYSVEPPVTQATLAALVARACPPIARRSLDADEAGPDRPDDSPADNQERTRPSAQRAAARPRPESVHTFATSAQFSEALANATPLLPFPALNPETARRITDRSPRRRPGEPAAAVRSGEAMGGDAPSDGASRRSAAARADATPLESGARPESGTRAQRDARTRGGPRPERGATAERGAAAERGERLDSGATPESAQTLDPGARATTGATHESGTSARRGARHENGARRESALPAASIDAPTAAVEAPARTAGALGRRPRARRVRWILVAVAGLALAATAVFLRGGAGRDRDATALEGPLSARSTTPTVEGPPGAAPTPTGSGLSAGATAPSAGGPSPSSGGTAPFSGAARAPAAGATVSGSTSSPPTSAGATEPRPGTPTGSTASSTERPRSSGSAGSAPLGSTPDVAPSGPGEPAGGGKGRKVRGRGTLQVGANPWADVYVDGALVGQAPGAWQLDAGAHAVELRHRDARRRFRVSIDPGETESLGLVDFAAP